MAASDALPSGARIGIAVQAYFRDAGAVVDELVQTASKERFRLSVRLVKGAYHAQERAEGLSVYQTQAETDSNFQAITEQLMRYAESGNVYPMIASMNAREQAWAIEMAQKFTLTPSQWESQMLYGMQPALVERLLARGQRLRLYLLFGENPAQGAQYFGRRLDELVGPDAHSRQVHDPAYSIESLSAIAPLKPLSFNGHQKIVGGDPLSSLLSTAA